MLKKIIEKHSQAFAEGTKMKKSVADKIIKMIVSKSEKIDNVSIEDFGIILSNLKYKLRMGIDMTELLNKAKDEEIESVIDELIKFRTRDELLSEARPVQNYSEKTESVWFFENMEFAEKNLKAGDQVKIQIMRVGKWNHPVYGEVNVTKETISDVISNFENRERGIDLAVDENHEPNHKALGWFKELFKKGKDNLFATIELTKKGAELINEGAYKYFSPELVFKKVDEESGNVIKNLLIGGAFTNRPFFKSMKPLMASEEGVASNNNKGIIANNHNNSILVFNDLQMNKFLRLLAQFSQSKEFSAEQVEELKAAFSDIAEEQRTPELESAFNEAMEKADEAGSESGEEEGKDAPEDKNEGADKGETEGNDSEGEGSEGEENSEEDSEEGKAKEVKASEGGEEVSVKMSEYNLLKKTAGDYAKLVAQAKKQNLEKAFSEMVFSEENKIGVVLPKHKKEVVEFAAGLSDKQAEAFTAIIQNLQTVAASEIGSNGEPAQHFNSEKIDFLTKKMGFSEEKAKEILAEESAK